MITKAQQGITYRLTARIRNSPKEEASSIVENEEDNLMNIFKEEAWLVLAALSLIEVWRTEKPPDDKQLWFNIENKYTNEVLSLASAAWLSHWGVEG